MPCLRVASDILYAALALSVAHLQALIVQRPEVAVDREPLGASNVDRRDVEGRRRPIRGGDGV